MSNRWKVNWAQIKEGKYRILLLVVLFIPFFLIWQNFAFSYTDSVGDRFFWRIDCPGFDEMQRWDLVNIKLDPDDKVVPRPEYYKLIKRVGCKPGEIVFRRDDVYFCKTQKGAEILFGKIKFETKNGVKLSPWLYDSKINYQEYVLQASEFFAFGKKDSGSYDSRYLGPIRQDKLSNCFIGLF